MLNLPKNRWRRSSGNKLVTFCCARCLNFCSHRLVSVVYLSLNTLLLIPTISRKLGAAWCSMRSCSLNQWKLSQNPDLDSNRVAQLAVVFPSLVLWCWLFKVWRHKWQKLFHAKRFLHESFLLFLFRALLVCSSLARLINAAGSLQYKTALVFVAHVST